MRILIIFIFVFCSQILSLDRQKQTKILWPLEKKLPISGSFAEFRNSSMHMGCDFKTFGINGFPVLGVYDGSITQISYSQAGYGLSIILSSNQLGLNSRYAHLHDLYGEITGLEEFKHALRLLGSKEGFLLKLRPDLFPVLAGMKIARAGETGSGVSHLHLEIMDSSGYINPLMLPNYQIQDTTPPIMYILYIDSDKAPTQNYHLKQVDYGKYVVDSSEEIISSGKIKLRLGGYDLMNSRNRNNIYGLRLRVNNNTVYQKTLDRMSYQEAGNREILYDVNKSSLSPPIYVYNFFDSVSNKPSVNLDEYTHKVNLELILFDASGNESILNLPIKIENNNLSTNYKSTNLFKSSDSIVELDFSKVKILQNGYISIERLSEVPEKFKSEDFFVVSDVYEIKAHNFSWRGEILGKFKKDFPNKEDSLYLYELNSGRWIPLNPKKLSKQMSFALNRLGILAVMKDKSPPVVNFPYLVSRDYNLPELKDKRMIERFYAIYDKGSGIAKMTVLLEGLAYPFEYDKDRGFIKLEVPLAFSKYKKHFFIQIGLSDKAGNNSEWFTDIISM